MNDRADEAAQWCERIMLAERRERLLAQYYSTDDVWLLNRLRGVIDDCLSWNSTDRPLFCHHRLGHRFDGPGYGRYGEGLRDRAGPVRAGVQPRWRRSWG